MERARNQLQKLAASVLSALPPQEAVMAAWPLICGSAVSQRSEAVRFEEGILTVEVPDAGWRRQLEQFTPHYLNAYRQLLDARLAGITYRIAGSKQKP